MKPPLIPLAALALAVGVAAAEQPPPAKDGQAPPKSVRPAAEDAASPAATLAALKKEFQQASTDRNRESKSAKTPADQQKAWQDHAKRRDAVLTRAVELARKNPTDPAALEALQWVIAGGVGWGPPTNAAFDLLAKDHVTSDKLERVCTMASIYSLSDAGERFLRAVLDKSPHHAVRGVACLSLGRRLHSKAETARFRKLPGADELQKESEKFYERVVAEFADVKANDRLIAERAKAALFEMQHLLVGKQAPDVTGEDLDGKTFKLSDYRGKVVVLDFWGNW